MIEYKLYKSPWKALKLMLLCSPFVLGGLFLPVSHGMGWFKWLSVSFFGLGYPIGLFQLLDRRPQLIINEIGIFDRMIHKDFINWEIIQDAYLAEVHNQKFICLVVDEKFNPSRMKFLSKAMGFQELNISLGNINVNAERLAEFILAMRFAERPERPEMIRKALSR
jgi:hypothetical protein